MVPWASVRNPPLEHTGTATASNFEPTDTICPSLSSSPPELKKAYVLKFLDSYAYFSFSLVFTLFLSDEFNMSDVRAGTIYGAWGALITIFGLFTGTVIDNWGVAKCLRVGFTLSLASRIAILACTPDSEGVLLTCLLVTLPFANCLGIPVLTVGIRRYTDEGNRGFAFGLFYVVMNVGALLAGPLVDVLTVYYNDREEEDRAAGVDSGEGDYADAFVASSSAANPSSWRMTANRAVILSGVLANVVAVFVAFGVREIKVNDAADGKHEGSSKGSPATDRPVPLQSPIVTKSISVPSYNGNGSKPPSGNGNVRATNVSEFKPVKGSTYQILYETVQTPSFRRFLVVCLLTINVRMVFRHLDGTLPKYMIREFGENTPKGSVYAINPALIIILVPIVTAATTSVDPLLMIHRGTYVSALSVFFLALSTSLPACVLFVATLSVGEAIWSPRLYDYTMSVAEEGREGTYMALSSAPLFLAKLPVGFLSGVLLQEYCPEELEEGEVRRSRTMWLIIGLTTIVSPIMITLLWGYISGGGGGEANESSVTSRARDGDVGGRLAASRNDDDGCTELDSSEHAYQHRPLVTNISLPRARQTEQRPLV